MNWKKDIIFPKTAVKGRGMSVDANRLTDLGTDLRVFLFDCF